MPQAGAGSFTAIKLCGSFVAQNFAASNVDVGRVLVVVAVLMMMCGCA
jgi:hypothetical protein